MATWTLGERIDDWLRLIDSGGAPITGAAGAITIAAQETDGPGSFGTIAIVETANLGTYRVSFTPTAAGDYYLALSHPTAVPMTQWQTYKVQSAAGIATAVVSAAGMTRQELRRIIATRLGDFQLATATEAGATDTFVDRVNLIDPARGYNGSVAYFTAGTAQNVGQWRRVIGSTDSGILTLQSALPAATAPGDQAEILNDRGQGWTPLKIHQLLNANIAFAASLHLEEIEVTLVGQVPAPGVAGLLDVSVTLPSHVTDLYKVEYQDLVGNWVDLPEWEHTGDSGFKIRPGGVIVISGPAVWNINAGSVKVYGYGHPAQLSADNDRTSVNAEWLIERTCADLLGESIHHARVPDTMRDYGQRGQRSDALRGRSRTLLKPNTVRIR